MKIWCSQRAKDAESNRRRTEKRIRIKRRGRSRSGLRARNKIKMNEIRRIHFVIYRLSIIWVRQIIVFLSLSLTHSLKSNTILEVCAKLKWRMVIQSNTLIPTIAGIDQIRCVCKCSICACVNACVCACGQTEIQYT